MSLCFFHLIPSKNEIKERCLVGFRLKWYFNSPPLETAKSQASLASVGLRLALIEIPQKARKSQFRTIHVHEEPRQESQRVSIDSYQQV